MGGQDRPPAAAGVPWLARSRAEALGWTVAYAVLCSVLALQVGDAVVSVTGSFLPAQPVRYGTVAVVLVVAGIACGTVLTAVGRAHRRR